MTGNILTQILKGASVETNATSLNPPLIYHLKTKHFVNTITHIFNY